MAWLVWRCAIYLYLSYFKEAPGVQIRHMRWRRPANSHVHIRVYDIRRVYTAWFTIAPYGFATSMDTTVSSQNREERLWCRMERERTRRAGETAERRLRRGRGWDRARCAAQSSERRESTLQQMHATSSERMASETAEEREARLQRIRDQLASETAKERAARDWYPRLHAKEKTSRLQQMSANQRERMISETAEERTARLQSLRDRLESETAEERTARLRQNSANQYERLASETAEERTTWLQLTNAHQRDRLANETAEEREARLQYYNYSNWHRELQLMQS